MAFSPLESRTVRNVGKWSVSGSGPYQGIGSTTQRGRCHRSSAAQVVPQQLQQLQQLEWAQQQQLQQIQQLVQVVAYQFQQLTQQLGAQGSFGAIAPQIPTSPFQTMLSPSAFSTQPLPVM